MIATTTTTRTADPEPLRLQIRPYPKVGNRERYRFARLNGWHCGHWHWTPDDALGCVTAKGAPMD